MITIEQIDHAISKDTSGQSTSIPWVERPANCSKLVWRHIDNPIITKENVEGINSVFNSAVIPFNDGFAGVFRCDDMYVRMNIHYGKSKDGIDWDIEPQPIKMEVGNTSLLHSDYRYDPRITKIDDKYWITWCNGYHGPTIGIAYTYDFKSFHQCENAFLPYNRNGVLFPKKINDKYVMLSRPSDNGHTAFGNIFLSSSPDMIYWGEHRHVMSAMPFEESGWQSTKIGAGPTPIETDEGWLVIYHGVITTCNGFRYAMGAALLDLHKPSQVVARSGAYILSPEKDYETRGDVPNVIFPCAALTEGDKIAIYYGAADTSVALCYGYISEILDFIKLHNVV